MGFTGLDQWLPPNRLALNLPAATPSSHKWWFFSTVQNWLGAAAMAQNGKAELTGREALVLLQRHSAWCWCFPEVSRAGALQHWPSASFDLIECVERGHAALMLCWQLKPLNWIKPQMFIGFDAIPFCFLLTEMLFGDKVGARLLIFSCLGLSCWGFFILLLLPVDLLD